MPPIAITEPARIYQCSLKFTLSDAGVDGTASSAFWVEDTALVAQGLTAVANLLDGNVTSWWGAASTNYARLAMSSGCTLTEIEVSQPIVDPEPAGAIRAIGGAGNGAEAVPAGIAYVVGLVTDTRGAAYRGRMYLPNANQDGNADGVTNATERTGLQGVFNTLLSDNLADSLQMVVVSRFQVVGGVTVPRVPPVRTAVQEIVVRTPWGSQRRRRS